MLGVLLVHTAQYGSFPNISIIQSLVSEGARGVQLFYLLSAFTLFLSFYNRSNREKNLVRNFFIRRFFRIAPMYYLGIIYYLFQDGLSARYWLGNATHISLGNIIANILFVHGFNPYFINSLVPGGWSIAVEMTFYAVLPLLFRKIKNLNQALNFFTFSTILSGLLAWILLKYPLAQPAYLWHSFLFMWFPSQLPIFVLGIIVYFIIIKKEQPINISGQALLFFSISLVAIQVVFGLPNHLIFGGLFLLLVIALSKYSCLLLINPLFTYLGKLSYSMYLIHFAVLHWLNKFNLVDYVDIGVVDFGIRFIIVILLTAVLSTLTYHIIEIPFQKLGKIIINKQETNRTV